MGKIKLKNDQGRQNLGRYKLRKQAQHAELYSSCKLKQRAHFKTSQCLKNKAKQKHTPLNVPTKLEKRRREKQKETHTHIIIGI